MLGKKKDAIYTYNYNTSSFSLSVLKLPVLIIPVVLTYIIFHKTLIFIPITAACISTMLFLFKYIFNKDYISITPDFLIYNASIFYYSSIQKITVNKYKHLTTIQLISGRTLIIWYDGFETNAQKEYKIKKNKVEKHYKVVRKLISKVESTNNSTEINIIEEVYK